MLHQVLADDLKLRQPLDYNGNSHIREVLVLRRHSDLDVAALSKAVLARRRASCGVYSDLSSFQLEDVSEGFLQDRMSESRTVRQEAEGRSSYASAQRVLFLVTKNSDPDPVRLMMQTTI